MNKKKARTSKSRTASSVKDLSVSPRKEKTVKGGMQDFHFTKPINKSSPKLFNV